MNEYWVLVENNSAAQLGLLEYVSSIAGSGRTVAAVAYAGADVSRLFACGADSVYLLSEKADARQAAAQITEFANKKTPDAILYSADERGRLIAAFVAASLRTGLSADCTGVRRDEGKDILVLTRPTFGGTLMADIICPVRRPQTATVRPGIYVPEGTAAKPLGRVEELPAADIPADAVLISRAVQEIKNLAVADVIVSGGKGIGSREGFALLEELADAIGGYVGASRAAVNAGYAKYDRQVGLTGQTVRPKLYLAFGISGAVQHIVGMEKAETVIAVNTDPNAPIFEYADYAIVADWQETAREMLRLLK